MADRVLTLRELNRATLARQLLLERATLGAPEAVERLVGLQAQQAMPPYVGLWTRLRDFRREELARLIEDRTVVKATLMRSTLHLFTAADYLRFRATLQPVLTNAFDGIFKELKGKFDVEKLVAVARPYIAEAPRTFAEITAMLMDALPGHEPGPLRYGVRTHLPLIQVPVGKGWSYPGNPQFTLAESWLNQPLPTEEDLRGLILRYLAAFGPARVTDMQTWSGLPKLKEVFETLRPELVTYRDEQGVELFDLSQMPLPAPDLPVPVRFLPEFDNLLLSHSNRTRVVADEFRKKVYLPGLRVSATILVDGFVAGAWKVEKKKGLASLVIQPFGPLTQPDRQALREEGEALAHFVEVDAKGYEVRFEE
ncbi:MAG: AlkZ family DNA glycosylase [Caldilineaceae bacterium]|nr:AlkZ family DNA glycosylase [Caldilineaceae bacterium]